MYTRSCVVKHTLVTVASCTHGLLSPYMLCLLLDLDSFDKVLALNFSQLYTSTNTYKFIFSKLICNNTYLSFSLPASVLMTG